MSAPPERDPAGGRPASTVLFVDDEPHVRSVARRILERAGYRVLLAEGGEEALRLAAGAELSVAVVDATMPGLSGAETLRRLRAQRPALPLVLTSGRADEEIDRTAAEVQARFLPKPFMPDDLRRDVERAIAGAGA